MVDGCRRCHADRTNLRVDADAGLVTCSECGHERAFVARPLLVVSGAAGTGKSTVRGHLAGRLDATLLEDDVLWHDAFDDVSEAEFYEFALWTCHDVGQSTPAVLFSSGMGVPANVEDLDNRRYFTTSHYLGLTCDDDVQRERLRARPGWAEREDYWADADKQVAFNQWFEREGDTVGVETVDTTDWTPEATADLVADWIRRHHHLDGPR